MVTAPVGYQLIDENETVLQSWGGIWGQMPSPPDSIDLPNGDRVFCPEVGAPIPYHPNPISPAIKIVILEVWEMEEPAAPVPDFVSNFQARAVMRQTFLPHHEGRSLFTVVNDAFKAGIAAAADFPENDPRRIEADVAWQAWEQANNYERNGAMMTTLGSSFGVPPEQIDELFRQADQIAA